MIIDKKQEEKRLLRDMQSCVVAMRKRLKTQSHTYFMYLVLYEKLYGMAKKLTTLCPEHFYYISKFRRQLATYENIHKSQNKVTDVDGMALELSGIIHSVTEQSV